MKNNNALNGKDFINIGIFTAIYMVIVIAIACTVGLIPIGFILLPIILPIIGGIPMMLYFTKIKKPGMLLIFEILFGIVMILTGMGVDLLIWVSLLALLVKFFTALHITRAPIWQFSPMAYFQPASAGTIFTGFLPVRIGLICKRRPMAILM